MFGRSDIKVKENVLRHIQKKYPISANINYTTDRYKLVQYFIEKYYRKIIYNENIRKYMKSVATT